MNTKHHLRIFFYVKKSEPLRDGRWVIMCRIATEGERCCFSTHLSVAPHKWNVVTQKAIGRNVEARQINRLLDDIRYALYEAYIKVLKSDLECTPQAIRDRYLGAQVGKVGLLEFFRRHNDDFAKQVGLTRSENTLNKYRYVCNHLERFVREGMHADDVALQRVNQDFIYAFHRWLMQRGCGVNTIRIYLSAFKRIIVLAAGQGLLLSNPFDGYRLHSERRRKCYLMKEELRRLIAYQPDSKTKQLVLDAFLFSCFTGLSFADIQRVTTKNIVAKGGYTYIYICRKKTHIAMEIPLLHLPQALLLRYFERSATLANPRAALFCLPSNFHCNNLLRSMLSAVGITRPITFHSARHTFATTIALANGVPLEVVSAMLGHSDIKTTQIYAKVLQTSVQSAAQHLSKSIKSYYFPMHTTTLCNLRP